MADKIVHTIHKLYPLARPPAIEPDLTTLRVLKEKLLAPDRESVLLYLQVTLSPNPSPTSHTAEKASPRPKPHPLPPSLQPQPQPQS